MLRITRRAVSDLQPVHFVTNAFNLSHWLFSSIRPEVPFHIIIVTDLQTENALSGRLSPFSHLHADLLFSAAESACWFLWQKVHAGYCTDQACHIVGFS